MNPLTPREARSRPGTRALKQQDPAIPLERGATVVHAYLGVTPGESPDRRADGPIDNMDCWFVPPQR